MPERRTIRDYLIGKSFYDEIIKQNYEILDVEGNGVGQTIMSAKMEDGKIRKYNFSNQLRNVETIVEPAET